MKPSFGNAKYFMNIYDQYSRFHKLYLLKTKSEAPDFITQYLAWFENHCSQKIGALMADGGREFINKKVKTALDKIGAEILVSNPATPQQNENSSLNEITEQLSIWQELC